MNYPTLEKPIDVKLIPALSDKIERVQDWVSLSVKIEVAPWHWRIGFYSSPGDGHFFILYLGPVAVHLWA